MNTAPSGSGETSDVRGGAAEVRNDSLGKLDEFIADNVNVHLERMNDGHWWLGITMRDGNFWHINLTTKRNTRIECFAESERHESRKSPPAQ